jgi:putative ABC transport system permease protein
MLTDLARELRHGFRAVRKAPGFALVIILTLALGVGANTAIFSVVNAVLLRPFPFREPARLAVLWEIMPPPNDGAMFLSPPDYIDFRDRASRFESLAGFAPASPLLATDQETIRLDGTRVTANLFKTLGVLPRVGRAFTLEDEAAGAAPVAIISDALLRGRFGGDVDIVGRAVPIDGRPVQIVGVMPAEFRFPPPIDLEGNKIPGRSDIWMPFSFDAQRDSRGAHYLTVVGRLRDGATLEQATSEAREIAANLAATFPETNEQWSARVVSMDDVVLGSLRPALLVLLAAVGLVLLIACVNVANLLLARATGRQKEFAVRAALGANRTRLVRQAIIESQVFALLGTIAGLGLAWIGTRVLLRLAPVNIPRLDQAGIDATVIAYALLLSVVTGLLFGLVPAIRAFTPDLTYWLREGARGGVGTGQTRLRDVLVVTEVALSLLLLVGAGLLFRSFLGLQGVDPGFRADQALTMRVSLPPGYTDAERRVAAFRAREERVRALPGVAEAGFSFDVPLASDYQGTEMEIEGEAPPPAGGRLANFSLITPGYLGAMGIPVLSGRGIENGDVREAEPVVVINEVAARRYFGGEDPIGRRIVFGVPRRIVGVVGDVHLESLTTEPFPTMYFPYWQSTNGRSLSLIVRASGDALSLVGPTRDAVRSVENGAPVYDVRLLSGILSDSIAAPRFSSTMLLVFSLAALLLAAVGIYGVISFGASLRTREIGVRMALGARPRDAMGMVMAHALRLAGAGIAVGMAAAFLLTRYLRSLLFGVDTTDPFVLAGTALFLVVVAVAAGGVPAWRASRIDPLEALRYE